MILHEKTAVLLHSADINTFLFLCMCLYACVRDGGNSLKEVSVGCSTAIDWC